VGPGQDAGPNVPTGRRPAADRGVYGISVAAELVGTGIQNLRLYEARGLLEPDRTDGGTRRYSANDLDRLRRIGDLLSAGLNLAGIGMVLDLEHQNAQLRAEKDAHDETSAHEYIPRAQTASTSSSADPVASTTTAPASAPSPSVVAEKPTRRPRAGGR
jgi:DNA-binding transcriptional MerR regulator